MNCLKVVTLILIIFLNILVPFNLYANSNISQYNKILKSDSPIFSENIGNNICLDIINNKIFLYSNCNFCFYIIDFNGNILKKLNLQELCLNLNKVYCYDIVTLDNENFYLLLKDENKIILFSNELQIINSKSFNNIFSKDYYYLPKIINIDQAKNLILYESLSNKTKIYSSKLDLITEYDNLVIPVISSILNFNLKIILNRQSIQCILSKNNNIEPIVTVDFNYFIDDIFLAKATLKNNLFIGLRTILKDSFKYQIIKLELNTKKYIIYDLVFEFNIKKICLTSDEKLIAYVTNNNNFELIEILISK